MTLTQGTEIFSLLFCCLPDILLSVDLCVPVCAPSRRTVAAVAAVFILRVCCVIHIPPLPSSVNYLFRLLRVRIKRPCSREHGQRWNDLPSESPYGRERTCSHGVLCQRSCGFVSTEAVPYRTEGNSTRVKLSFYYYLEKNRKIGRSGIVNFL